MFSVKADTKMPNLRFLWW